MSGDVNGLRAGLPALNETLSLGEWGKMFYDKWWRSEEVVLVKTDPWKRACEGETPFIPNMTTPVVRKPVRHDGQTSSPVSPFMAVGTAFDVAWPSVRHATWNGRRRGHSGRKFEFF